MDGDYQQFLRGKINLVERTGFAVDRAELHAGNFPHQNDAIIWAAGLGRGLIAMSFGLGKTRIQCELARLIHERTKRPFLVVCPLGVKHQFAAEDGPALGMRWQYVRTDAEIQSADSPYLITNYERVRDGDITPARHDFAGVSLDEGSVLRSLGSKTYQTFNQIFAGVPFRYVATATPSPNEYKELIHYAEFLGVMDRGQALTRWFKRDSQKAGHLTIHPQHEKDFWLWVASWALFLFKPSDLGYSDAGYVLPELRVHWHRLKVDQRRAWSQVDNRGQGRLLLDAAGGVSEMAAEKRETLPDRIMLMREIVLQHLGTQDYSAGDQDDDRQREKQSVLRGTQGRGETAVSGLVSPEQGQNRPREEERIYAGVSEDVQASEEDARRDCGEKQEEARAVCYGPGAQREDKTAGEGEQSAAPGYEESGAAEGGIRDHSGAIRRDIEETGWRLCDLRQKADGCEGEWESGEIDARGPQSQDRRGAGPALPTMQFRNRSISGQPGSTPKSGLLPEQWIIWCHLNSEQRAVEQVMREHNIAVSSIYGSLSIEETEQRLFAWMDRDTDVLLSKPVMLGSGLNLQQCHQVLFLGVDYKFQDFIQAIHRTHRFQQEHPVDVHIIYAESEDEVVAVLRRKWEQHNRLVEQMREITQRYGLSHAAMRRDLARTIGVERVEVRGERFTAVNNDCVDEVKRMEENSIDLIHTSIPFGNHYEYTAQVEDFGHNPSDAEFWQQMDYLIPDLRRILKPGRVAAIHVKDRILYGHQTKSGFMEVAPFSDECVQAFRQHGWMYEGRRTIVTDVVRENASTYRLGYTEMTHDATKMGCGLPEYLLLFRKAPSEADTARADEPVVKDKADFSRARWQVNAHSFWRSNGNTPLLPHEWYDYEAHVNRLEELERAGNLPASFFYEPPQSPSEWVWDDVIYMRSLNSEQSRAREENHICPLPFDIVERTVGLYSNPGDLVFDPFAGLFTVPVIALKLGRRGYGVELSGDYFEFGLKYCQDMERQVTTPTLFDHLDAMKAQAGKNGKVAV